MADAREKLHTNSQTLKLLVFVAVGFLFLGWLFNTPLGLLGKADAIGYAVCHRIDLRSFHLGDRTLPLCARCTGMFLGTLVSLGLGLLAVVALLGIPTDVADARSRSVSSSATRAAMSS